MNEIQRAKDKIQSALAIIAGEFDIIATEDDAGWVCVKHREQKHVFFFNRQNIFTRNKPDVEQNPHAFWGYSQSIDQARSAARAEAFRRGWGDDDPQL